MVEYILILLVVQKYLDMLDARMPESGKYYWEIYVNTRGSSTASIGISSEDQYINNYSTHKDFLVIQPRFTR